MLNAGTSGSGGISDLYTKLDHINNGLQVGGQTINFYNTSGTKTPINLVSSGDGKINITLGEDNAVVFGLSELTSEETTASQILKSITVDKYGRVTAVTGESLTNDDLPSTISGKTFSGCVTDDSDIGTNEKAIVNKAYVDTRLQELAGVATGALKFKGSLNTTSYSESWLNDNTRWHTYYKVTEDIQVNKSDLFDQTGLGSATKVTIKAGDTLIIYPESDSVTRAKWVHIPSGDETITTITVKEGSTTKLGPVAGPVSLKFGAPFTVVHESDYGNQAHISLPISSATQDGYLSKEDWVKFNSYASNLATTYTGLFNSGDGVYQIGTLSIGGVEQNIYGKNNISSLTLNNGSVSEYNPILKFTETGTTDVDITFAGLAGLVIKKNGNVIEFAAANEVIDQAVPQINNPRTAKYLTITDGYKFGVQLGSVDADGKVTDGLTDFSQFNALVNTVASIYETISYSLIGADSTTEYRYGNALLKAAINVTI